MTDYFEEYRIEHEITSRLVPYTVCQNLKFSHADGCKEFCEGWSIIPSPDGTVTVVYHIDEMIDSVSFDEAWSFIGNLYQDCEMTFDQVEGMWKNGGFPRIYCRIQKDNLPGVMKARLNRAFITVACALRGVWFYYSQSVGENGREGIYGDAALVRFIEGNISPIDVLSKIAVEGAEFYEHLPEIERKMAKNSWDFGEGKGFEMVAGFDALKARLSDTVLWTLKHKEEAERYRIAPPNAMLLYGPPGCGKTYFAKNFADEAGYRFKVFTPSDLGNPFVHGSQNLIAEMFAEARRQAPCVVCLEEVDAMMPARGNSASSVAKNEEVNEFLAQMNDCGRDEVFVIGTTNMKELLDPAALRTGRFDLQIEIPMPDAQQREALFSLHLKDRPLADDINAEELSVLCDGMTASDITFIVNDAALACARNEAEISQDALKDAISALRGSRDKNNCRKIGY